MTPKKKRETVGWRTAARVDKDTGVLIVLERELYRDELEAMRDKRAKQKQIEFPGGPGAPLPPPSR